VEHSGEEDDGDDLLSRWTYRRAGTSMFTAVRSDLPACCKVVHSFVIIMNNL